VLSPLQERVAAIVSGLPEAAEFALAGGAALITRGDVERETEDLDFFATGPEAVGKLLPALEVALAEAGIEVERQQVAEGFVRLAVAMAGERTRIDLCWDSRLFPTELSRIGPVLAGEELAASKLLALFTRAAARDFLDVYALSGRYGFERLCELAAQKDPGFHLEALADALGAMTRLPRQAFDVDDRTLEELRSTVAEWRAEVRRRAGSPDQLMDGV
jgi:hypothetical protein